MEKPGANRFRRAALALDIALTSSCPLRCRYCTVEKTDTQELDSALWADVAASFARHRVIDLISLEGGEPFVRHDLADLAGACLKCARAVKIVTSGVIPLDSLPDRLLRHPGLFLELSLDGPPEIHNLLRDGSWERAWEFLTTALQRGIRVRLRSVISSHNLSLYEGWLASLDRALEPFGRRVPFSFDTIIAPETLAGQGGEFPRAGVRSYPSAGLLPSPLDIGALFRRLKKSSFRTLVLRQSEPLRGCGAAGGGFISFDPAGIFSLCCEAPRGHGSILQTSPEECLAFLDFQFFHLPCDSCSHLRSHMCNGCWTGQKCGMVGHFGFTGCRALLASMGPGHP